MIKPCKVDAKDGGTAGPIGDLERARLGYLMRDAAMLMRRRFTNRARAAGLPLTQSEARTLSHVAREPGLHQAALSARLDVEPIALVRLLNNLQQAELIERRQNEADGRVWTIWPTEAAVPILKQINMIRKEVYKDALRGIPDDIRELLIDSLIKIRTNLS
jgi:MarR family transcriptional regulator for hemolysin